MSRNFRLWITGAVWSLAVLFTAPSAFAIFNCNDALNPPEMYRPCQFEQISLAPAGNAYKLIDMWADFTGPQGQSFRLYGYFENYSNGFGRFRFRFTGTASGTWTYVLGSNTAGAVPAGSKQINVGLNLARRGFLRRDNVYGQRLRFDNTNAYFFMSGQTYYQTIDTNWRGGAWANAHSMSKMKGMNKVRILAYPWWGAWEDPVNPKDSQPFKGVRANCTPADTQHCPDYYDPDVTHWARLDQIVEDLNSRDMIAEIILFKDEAVTKPPNPVVLDNFRTFGTLTDHDTRYARYIVARYGAFPNVIWCLSNEWQQTDPASASWFTTNIAPIITADPYYNAGGRYRLATIHGNKSVTPDAGFPRVTAGGWMTSAVVQYGQNRNGGANPDQWGTDVLNANNAANIPMIDDEYGYLGQFAAPAQLNHRRAIWGFATAGVYASVGSLRGDPTPTVRTEWVGEPEYDDIRHLVEFFTDPARNPAVTNFERMTRDNNVINPANGRRVYHIGDSNEQHVLYDAIGTTAFSINLPGPGSGRSYKIWWYDPAADYTGYTPVGTTHCVNFVTTCTVSISVPAGRANLDTVYLVKRQ